MNEEPPKMHLRVGGNPLAGENYKGLTEDERAMQRLVLEEYKKDGRVYIKEVRRAREADPKMPLGEVIKNFTKK